MTTSVIEKEKSEKISGTFINNDNTILQNQLNLNKEIMVDKYNVKNQFIVYII